MSLESPPTPAQSDRDAEITAIAHDFNNLLGVIVNFTQFAIDGTPETSPAYADLAEVRQAAERGTELTRRLTRTVLGEH